MICLTGEKFPEEGGRKPTRNLLQYNKKEACSSSKYARTLLYSPSCTGECEHPTPLPVSHRSNPLAALAMRPFRTNEFLLPTPHRSGPVDHPALPTELCGH